MESRDRVSEKTKELMELCAEEGMTCFAIVSDKGCSSAAIVGTVNDIATNLGVMCDRESMVERIVKLAYLGTISRQYIGDPLERTNRMTEDDFKSTIENAFAELKTMIKEGGFTHDIRFNE